MDRTQHESSPPYSREMGKAIRSCTALQTFHFGYVFVSMLVVVWTVDDDGINWVT